MKEGFIWYKNKPTHIIVKSDYPEYMVVITDDGEILGIPFSDNKGIWETAEECEYRCNGCYCHFVPQGV